MGWWRGCDGGKRWGVPNICNITLLVVLKFHLKNSYLPHWPCNRRGPRWCPWRNRGMGIWPRNRGFRSNHIVHSRNNEVQDICSLDGQGQFVCRGTMKMETVGVEVFCGLVLQQYFLLNGLSTFSLVHLILSWHVIILSQGMLIFYLFSHEIYNLPYTTTAFF